MNWSRKSAGFQGIGLRDDDLSRKAKDHGFEVGHQHALNPDFGARERATLGDVAPLSEHEHRAFGQRVHGLQRRTADETGKPGKLEGAEAINMKTTRLGTVTS